MPWGPYLRYAYVTADFSAAKAPGLYYIQYGNQKTGVFPIGPQVHGDTWHLTQDVWFPVQMDHMRVNEAYRLWHAVPHRDDARQAPLNFQHFDNYRMGPTTETQFKPGEHIPGLDVGGWFDAGDFDIETAHHTSVVIEHGGHVGVVQADAGRDARRPGRRASSTSTVRTARPTSCSRSSTAR